MEAVEPVSDESAMLSVDLPTPAGYVDPQRNGLNAVDLFDGITEHLLYTLGRRPAETSLHDL